MAQEKAVGWIDGYRRAADIVSALSGEVVEVNEAVLRNPRQVNAYPYARAGLFKVRVASAGELDSLMDFEAYADQIRKLRRHDGRTRDLRMM